MRILSHLGSSSLYRLFWLVIILVALLPTVLVTYLLLDKVAQQSREQVLASLSHRAELQSELLEQQLAVQLNSLERLSQTPDVRLTPTSAVFGYQAGVQLKKFIGRSPTASASYILDRDHWPVEVYPIAAEQVKLASITSRVEPFLQQVEQEQIIKPLVFNINDPAVVAALNENNLTEGIKNSWIMVMVLPLIQETQHGSTKFKVVGSLVTLEPYQFFSEIFEKWRSDNGGLQLLEQDVKLYSTGLIKENEADSNIMSWDAAIKLADKTFILRITEPSEDLKAIVFEDLWRLSLIVGSILLFVSFISLLITRLVGQQIAKLISQVKAFSQGDYQYHVSGLRFSEFLQISAVLEQLSEKVITDQIQLEQKVEERTQALSQTNKELNSTLAALTETQSRLVQSEKMASLGQLTAGIAHELNTPLGICVTAAGLVEGAGTNLSTMVNNETLTKSELTSQLETLAKAAALISSNVRRSSDLVSMFKELSLEHGPEGVTQFELKSFLQQLANVWLYSQEDAGIEIQISGDEIFVQTYIGILRKVLSVFFSNALAHAFKKQTGAEFQPKVQLDCRMKNGLVELYFIDNGCGVDIEPIARIFEPFYTSNRYQGSVGLGLHLAYNLVTQRLEGEIEAENCEEGGLKLCLIFPRLLELVVES
ncbi:sensor histidine kinase [Psychromonas aquimarina]|uniref:sensor histidine kinase n=1 Tax=Psychromonas aquimarina TaxID=444919 RepID=UPI00048BF54A|nr:ATP-binding protein [Psychromonas aquimarina]